MKKLSDKIKTALEYQEVAIPPHISENLSKELRVYQEDAIRYFLLQRKKPNTNHLMFNMATGSGKTLVMASLILDCYKNGYRDFIFFVNSTAIVEKTKANFADKNSSKYLFKENIFIDSKNVEINVITSLSDTKDDCINIYFTTVQSLFNLFKTDRENFISLQDLEDRKLVFLADEAHHLNADTKKNDKKSDEKEGWEAVIQKAYESNEQNLMLEFSATIPKESAILDKYKDKIIYEYDLAKFCNDGYSKRIFMMKYENNDMGQRFLGAMLLSLFRELVAKKYKISLKPVILFKSESISASKENEERFLEFLENLDSHMIEDFYKSVDSKDSEQFSASLRFFENEFTSGFASKIVSFLKNNFKSSYILNTNDDKELEKNQILLNSLEDSGNQIRIIFTVDKLNEGWDVLNLFDIVRLGNTKNSTAVTTKEAQLIGRGARYCPFDIKNIGFDFGLTYKRKFDSDLKNDLSILERLSYHTLNEVDFIKNLNKAMQDQGLLIEETTQKVELSVNDKAREILETNKVFYAKNRRVRKMDLKYFEITQDEIAQKIRSLEIPFFSKSIKESEEKFEITSEEFNLQKLERLGDKIDIKFFLKAMNILKLTLAEINENFTFDSKKEFIDYLLGIDVRFSSKQTFSLENNLEIAKFIVENFKTIKQAIKLEYEVSDFEPYKLDMGERVIFRDKDKVCSSQYGWLYYDKYTFDSKLEKEFLDFISSIGDRIDSAFSQWFIVRNDGFEEFKIYDNRKDEVTYGQGFEPDFIFFGKRVGDDEGFLSIECFIEAKGGHLSGSTENRGVDKWKEEFLETLKSKEFKIDNNKLSLSSMPFFIEKNDIKFSDAFTKFLGQK